MRADGALAEVDVPSLRMDVEPLVEVLRVLLEAVRLVHRSICGAQTT